MNKNELSMEDLRQAVAKYNRPVRDRILGVLAKGSGLRVDAIAELVFTSSSTVAGALSVMLRSGQVKRVQVGRMSFYYREGVADGQAVASAVVGRGRPAGRSRRGRARKGRK